MCSKTRTICGGNGSDSASTCPTGNRIGKSRTPRAVKIGSWISKLCPPSRRPPQASTLVRVNARGKECKEVKKPGSTLVSISPHGVSILTRACAQERGHVFHRASRITETKGIEQAFGRQDFGLRGRFGTNQQFERALGLSPNNGPGFMWHYTTLGHCLAFTHTPAKCQPLPQFNVPATLTTKNKTNTETSGSHCLSGHA